MTPPTHILEAAATIQNWMTENGHRDWQLGRICDRSHAYKLGVCNEHYERLTAANTELRKLNDDLAATLQQTREKYGIGDRHVMREKNQEIAKLRAAFLAAQAFLESHVADPDITDNMAEKYAAYQKASKDLEP